MFERKRNKGLFKWGGRLAFLFVYVTVLLSLLIPAPAYAQPTGYQEYYVLGYEEHAWRAFLAINDDDPDPAGLQIGRICSTVSLVATADHQVIYYDHWEDGYEADLLNPVQSTTEVYGTGSDILLAGDDITLTSDQGIGGSTVITASVPVSPTRNSAYIRYDGGDRIFSVGGPVDVAHAMWPLDNSWVGGAWEIYSRQAYASAYSYHLPIGEDLYYDFGEDTGIYGDFRNVFLQLEAFEDNTTVSIDNGTDTVNLTLDQGQTYFSMGYINSTSVPSITIDSGTVILSNKPTQVGLMTGADGTFQGRFLVVLPDQEWGADYVVPVPRGDYTDVGYSVPAEVYLSNPNDFPIEIQAYDVVTQTSFVVSPTTYLTATVPYSEKRGGYYVPEDSAARFTSSEGVFGVIVAASTSDSAYDWGFAGIPAKYLTQDYYVSWAPGNSCTPLDDPSCDGDPYTAGIQPAVNGSPVWVTPLADDTTFYVDYSPLDGEVDQTFTLDTLRQQRIFDPDNDNTGMHVWATDEFAVAWGADPRTAGAADPYLDLGLATLPLHEGWLDLALTLDKVAEPTILPPAGGTVTFTLVTQAYDKRLANVDITDTLPINWNYVTNSTLVTYPDSSTGNPEPTIDGQTLFWDLSTSLDLNQSLTLTFQAQVATGGGVGATAYDGFESGDYAGGKNWTGDWQEVGDDGSPTSDQIRNYRWGSPFAGDRHVRIIGPNNKIYRTVDLSEFTSPTLRFMRKVDLLEGDHSDEVFYLDIYDGENWAMGVLTWNVESQQGFYVGEMVDLTPYASSDSWIQFRSGEYVDGGGDWTFQDRFYVDEVEIYDAAAINTNEGEAIGEHESSGALFNPSDKAYVYISSLNLVKSVSSAQAGIGDTLVYTLSCSNASPSISATNVVLRDPIPVQYITFLDASTGGVYNGASGMITWDLGALLPDATETVTFAVKVNNFVKEGTVIKNVGYVNSDQTVETGSNEVRTRVSAPGVEFTKLGPTVAFQGSAITYTLSYENVGGGPATAVTIQDTVPLSTTYVAGSLAINTGSGWTSLTDASDADQGAFISPTLTIAPGVSPGTIAAGEWGQIRYSVLLDDENLSAGSLILNSATLDRNLDIPRDSNTVATRIADLLLHKAADQSVVAPGDVISYTLTYENASETTTQTNVYLYESIPAYTHFISNTAQSGDQQIEYSWDNGATWVTTLPVEPVTDIRWYDAEVPTGAQETASFAVQVTDPLPEEAIIENMAHISSTETSQYLYEQIPSNQVEIKTVNLWIEKDVSQNTALAGEPITYTISYGNQGSADDVGVQITDTVPSGANYIAGTIWGTGADESESPTLVWDVMTATAGLSNPPVGYAVVLEPSLAPGPFTNTAVISSAHGSWTSDPVTVTVVTAADLAVAKSDNPDPVVAGTVLTYTLFYTNSGPSDAQGVTITDTLPGNVAYGGVVSSLFTDPNQTGQQLTWYTPTLPAGASGSIVFTVMVDADATGIINNNVVITSSTSDPAPSNNTATDGTTVNSEADLAISKSDDPDPVDSESTLAYTLSINNTGPSMATAVTVTDTLPTGVTYDNASGSGWNCNHNSGVVICTRSSLAVGIAPDIFIEVTTSVNGGIIANMASVGATTPDPDGTDNAITTETQVIAVTDLQLSKTAAPSTVSPGQALTYTLTYINQGSGVATGVIITDIVPITLTNVGYTSSGAQITPTGSLSYTWQVADIASGEGGVITIAGVVAPDLIADTGFTNDAIIATGASAPVVDTNPANNDDSASTTVNLPRVSFSSATYNVAEDAVSATVTVTLHTSPFVTVTVDYATDDGSAIAGDDYTAVGDTLTFAPGVINQNFIVPITDDDLDEDDETVQLTLSDPNKTVLDTPAIATLTIADDDTAGADVDPTTVDVSEDGISDTYQVMLTSQPTSIVTVTFNIDVQLEPIAPLTFDDTNWDIPQVVTVTAVDDDQVEDTPHTSIISHTASSGDADYDGISIDDVTVNIADNNSAGVIISPSILNVSEGGITATYEVMLTSQPSADVTIDFFTDAQLDPVPALTFDGINWNNPQIVTIFAIDDDVDEASPHTSIISHTATSGDPNYDGITPIISVTVNIADDDTAGVDIHPTTVSVSEDGITNTYDVALTSQPTATVTITFTTDAQLNPIPSTTFTTLTWNITQTVAVSAVDDDVDETSPHTSTITHAVSSDDTIYAGISADSVTVSIADNNDAGVSIHPSSVNVSEGGITDTYQVALTSQPSAVVTITFNTDTQLGPIPALTFDSTNWAISQTVVVSAVNDAYVEGTPHVSTIHHAVSSADARYDGIAAADVTVNITDDDSAGAGVSVNPTIVSVSESGATDTYQVVLAIQPTATVTITFTTDAQIDPIASRTFTTLTWSTPQIINVSAVDDNYPEGTPHVSTINHTVSSADGRYDGIPIPDVTVRIADNDSTGAGISIHPTTVNVSESGSDGTYEVVLASRPTAAVTITFNTDPAQVASVAPEPLIFDGSNWDSPQTVTVSAVDDDRIEGTPHFSTINHTASSADVRYDGISIHYVTVRIADNDTAGVDIIPPNVDVSESGITDTYQVVLTSRPATTVTLFFSSGAQIVAIVPLAFNETNWDVSQTVVVSAIDDDVDETSPHTGTINHTTSSADTSYDGIAIEDVIASITDDDTAGVNITPITAAVSEAGLTDTYQVVLESQPIATVTITFTTDAQLDPIPSLTFFPLGWNSPQTITVSAVDDEVDETSPHISIITHTVSSSDANYDNISTDNVIISITDDDSRADLAISKSSSSNLVIAGTILTYTITYTNNGTSSAQDIFITDTLSTEVVYGGVVSSPLGEPTQTGRRLTWYASSLAVGERGTIIFTVTVDAGASNTIINSVSITSATPDPNLNNNEFDESTTAVAEVNLSISKSDMADPVLAGAVLTYTLVYANDGPSDAQDVIITDTLPIGVTYGGVVSSSLLDPNLVGQKLTWYAPTLAAREGGAIVFTVTITSSGKVSGTIINNADITSSMPDPNPNDNSDDESTDIIIASDLAITKSGDPGAVAAGGVLTYTLSYINNGPLDAREVIITDTLPTGVTYGGMVDAPLGDPSQMGRSLTWYSPTLAAGKQDAIVFTVTVDPGATGAIINSVTITSAIPDPDSDDNFDDLTANIVTQTDLTIGKKDSSDPAGVGMVLTYTLIYTNNGPSDAQTVVITDTLPASVTYGGTVTSSTPLLDPEQAGRRLVWRTPMLAAGDANAGAIVFTVTVGADPVGVITNSVVITSATPDSNPNNNGDAERTNVVIEADLSIGKFCNPGTVIAGAMLTCTLSYANGGPLPAEGVVITDTLPISVTYGGMVNAPLGDPSQVDRFLIWRAPTLAAGGASAGAIVYTVTVAPYVDVGSVLTNSVVITSTTSDPDANDNSDEESIIIVPALAITKTVADLNGTPLYAGDVLEYQVQTTNISIYSLDNVYITDPVPGNTALVVGSTTCTPGALCTEIIPDRAASGLGSFGPSDVGGMIVASIESLDPGGVFTLTFRVTVNDGVVSIDDNIAVTKSDSQSELESDPVGGGAVEPGLAINKSATDLNDVPLEPGDKIEYQIVVRNYSSIYSQHNVTISDTVPVSTTLVVGSVTCFSPAVCGESGGVITATVSSLAPGGSLILIFQVTVNEGVSSVGGNIAAVESDAQNEQETEPVYPYPPREYIYLPLVMRNF